MCICLCSCRFSQLFTFQQQFNRNVRMFECSFHLFIFIFFFPAFRKSLDRKMLLLQLFNWKMISSQKERKPVDKCVSSWRWVFCEKKNTRFRIATEHIFISTVFSCLVLRLHKWQAIKWSSFCQKLRCNPNIAAENRLN